MFSTSLTRLGKLVLALSALASGLSLFGQSLPLPTDRARVQIVSIPDAYNPAGPALKVLRTDANTPLRASTAWIWEKQRQEEDHAYYAKLRANGLNAIRMVLFDTWEVEAYDPSPVFIPTDWNAPSYRARQLARMERAVNYASAHGMYVVINSHNKIPNYNASYADALWTHVAPYFASRTHVLYEASNEPMSGIGRNGDMDEPTGALNSARLQALKTTYNLIRAAAPHTHIMILTPPGINDGAFGTGLGNLAASFSTLPGFVDWTKTSVAYHLYNNDAAYGAATNAANLRNLHSRYPGWPSENAFPPGNFPDAMGLDKWRSSPFGNDLWVNQTCERLGLGWSMWFLNGHTQFDNNFPIMMADAYAKGWNWTHDPLIPAPSASPAVGNITGPVSLSQNSTTPGAELPIAGQLPGR
ncbi:MAG: cellulase family glycosylhydrolase [Verrucomicrobiae bacterium]